LTTQNKLHQKGGRGMGFGKGVYLSFLGVNRNVQWGGGGKFFFRWGVKQNQKKKKKKKKKHDIDTRGKRGESEKRGR